MIGDVVDIGGGRRHEFFSFKEPAPRQLELAVTSKNIQPVSIVNSNPRLPEIVSISSAILAFWCRP